MLVIGRFLLAEKAPTRPGCKTCRWLIFVQGAAARKGGMKAPGGPAHDRAINRDLEATLAAFSHSPSAPGWLGGRRGTSDSMKHRR